MLSPNNRIVLLPQDREIMDITGMSEEEYRWFVRECYKHQKVRPGEPVASPLNFLSILAIGRGSPRQLRCCLPQSKRTKKPRTPEEETVEGQNVIQT